MKRKIIQISTIASTETYPSMGAGSHTYATFKLFALCDDGCLFVKSNDNDWKIIDDVPQGGIK